MTNRNYQTLRDVRLEKRQLPYLLGGMLAAGSYGAAAVLALPWLSAMLWLVTSIWIYLRIPAKTRRYMMMVVIMFIIMSVTPVGTSTDPKAMIVMGVGMTTTVLLPFFAQRYIFREDILHIRLKIRRKWTRREIGYIVFATFFIPFWLGLYFFTSNASAHWHMSTPLEVGVVFGSIMLIGVWEEMVFIATVFGLLRRYLPYAWANLVQALFFTAFLYQIGFQGWIVINLFLYALYQGMVYYRTGNLATTLIIHAIVDIAVFATIFVSILTKVSL